ncbi:TonB C-terminal domain-containing protein [Massilia sp. LXY-6]|uniref:TonB C-terminal domain-containing protein n=1 Tax=Massilia sp. LXY-6 TaxID=3379823 RepID=UPI003F4A160E
MSTALLIAVLFHALLLSVTFGGQAFGLPGFKLPWKERRLGADALQVILARLPPPAPPAKEANPVLALEDVTAIGSTVSSMWTSPIATPLPNPKPAAASAPASAVEPVLTVNRQTIAPLPTAPVAQQSLTHIRETPIQSVTRDAAQPPVEQATQERAALDQAGLEQETQREENLRRTELMAAAQREAARQELLRVEAARLNAERQEEKAREDAARQEQEKAAVLRQEAARNEVIRQEQAKLLQLELQRQERVRQEAARQVQAKQAQLEAQGQEALRQQQANQAEQARQAAEKQEQERADAARRDAAQQEQAKRDQALRDKARQEAEREERLKAIGKQLDREAAQRDAASRSSLPSASKLRRGWLFGRADANRDLVLYAETMSQKIEKNMTFEMVRELIKQAYNRPTVTIAVRADGTVEKVSFVTSSGVAAIDEAIRKVIASQAPYGAFPPSLARQYDVIEIRRTWVFDIAIRLE